MCIRDRSVSRGPTPVFQPWVEKRFSRGGAALSELGVLSYGVAAVGWLVLLLLLLTSWRGRLQGGLLVTATLISLSWALRAAYDAGGEEIDSDWWYEVLEAVSYTHLVAALNGLNRLA